ncbi:unnamed protein product [Onchocerca flexuosa]|uniref:Neurobeachin n=1 Tax=Onchocerca flexuosa TaxID=387005 RepID=A0A183GZM4_9BILA|nr:unnamed protein product [Onchocerca flexuosa]
MLVAEEIKENEELRVTIMNMSKTVKKPIPLFVHYGFLGGVSCSAIVSVDNESHLAVGTTCGKCTLFSPRTHLCTSTIHNG